MVPRDSLDTGVMFNLIHISIKLVPYVQVGWQHWTSETINISINRLILAGQTHCRLPTSGAPGPPASNLCFPTVLHQKTRCRHLGTAVWLLFVHTPPPNRHKHEAGKQRWSRFKHMLFLWYGSQCFSVEALKALCNPRCRCSHGKVNGGWEEEKSLPQVCQGWPEFSLEILVLSIWQRRLMRIWKAAPLQLAGCSPAAARIHAVLRNARRLLSGYVFPLTAFPGIKLCCLQ